jgi:hypothetical protein
MAWRRSERDPDASRVLRAPAACHVSSAITSRAWWPEPYGPRRRRVESSGSNR